MNTKHGLVAAGKQGSRLHSTHRIWMDAVSMHWFMHWFMLSISSTELTHEQLECCVIMTVCIIYSAMYVHT